jgi:hypothetical protein
MEDVLEAALLDGTGVDTGYPPPYGVETALEGATPEQAPSLEIPNWVEYWYWPVTSSMSWRP